jgi:hypothetical protein
LRFELRDEAGALVDVVRAGRDVAVAEGTDPRGLSPSSVTSLANTASVKDVHDAQVAPHSQEGQPR